MKLHEYQAKEIFARYGIPVPQGRVATTPAEARAAAAEFGGRAVVKAQVHAGGRGKAGGVQMVHSPDDAAAAAQAILSARLVTNQTGPEGVPVNQALIEETADIAKEMYVALTIDRIERRPVLLVSAAGGMDIEQVAESSPESIHAEPVDPALGLMPYQSRRIARMLGLQSAAAAAAPPLFSALYRIFADHDCTLVEVNPLIVTGDGRLVALDAKISIDDDAMFRHPEIPPLRDVTQEDELEAQAADLDIAYVNLDGDVGCLVNGAGLAMATLDVTSSAGAAPANFLDVGGGASVEKVASAVSIILSDPKVRRVLVNVFGGILRCDIAAEGIVQAYRSVNSNLPLVVRMLGTNVDDGKRILADSNLPVVFAETLSEAAAAIQRATNNPQLPDTDIWFVRAERANILAQTFLEQGIVAMGWGIGPVKADDSRNEILARLEQNYPDESPGTLRGWASQIKRFTSEMATGDAVATVSADQPQGRLCHIGIIRSLLAPAKSLQGYVYDHVHQVEWLYQIPQNELSEYTQRRLELPPTLHRLSPEASAELRQHCSG